MYLCPVHLHIIYAQYIILITPGEYVPAERPTNPFSLQAKPIWSCLPAYLPAPSSTLHVIVST